VFVCYFCLQSNDVSKSTLYSAIKPEILRGEIEILQTLAGKRYCMAMHCVYETPKYLYVITEFCAGGEMMEYVAHRGSDDNGTIATTSTTNTGGTQPTTTTTTIHDLRTEDVSRIAYQLLSAVDHCAQHQVLHRDIKQENVMFINRSLTADLRLIDFGSGCIDHKKTGPDVPRDAEGLIKHTTVRDAYPS
jgi:serine/threonine protein kinase